jgi:hypothetical protein
MCEHNFGRILSAHVNFVCLYKQETSVSVKTAIASTINLVTEASLHPSSARVDVSATSIYNRQLLLL